MLHVAWGLFVHSLEKIQYVKQIAKIMRGFHHFYFSSIPSTSSSLPPTASLCMLPAHPPL
jgi:hypothetical protein